MSKMILVADDDKLYRDNISLMLTKEGFEVKVLKNAENIFKELKSKEYSVLILDIYMDGMENEHTISKIKKLKPDMPIIVITGDNSLDLERRIRQNKIHYYLVKPFAMNELKEVILSITNNKTTS